MHISVRGLRKLGSVHAPETLLPELTLTIGLTGALDSGCLGVSQRWGQKTFHSVGQPCAHGTVAPGHVRSTSTSTSDPHGANTKAVPILAPELLCAYLCAHSRYRRHGGWASRGLFCPGEPGSLVWRYCWENSRPRRQRGPMTTSSPHGGGPTPTSLSGILLTLGGLGQTASPAPAPPSAGSRHR